MVLVMLNMDNTGHCYLRTTNQISPKVGQRVKIISLARNRDARDGWANGVELFVEIVDLRRKLWFAVA